MPLSMTKIAYRSGSLDNLRRWVEAGPEALMTTRYLPKRHAEMIGGSLYWIVKHRLVARQAILGFEERAEDHRTLIRLDAALIPVRAFPKRAHQGWRYLEEQDAPRGADDGSGIAALPPRLYGKLAALALV